MKKELVVALTLALASGLTIAMETPQGNSNTSASPSASSPSNTGDASTPNPADAARTATQNRQSGQGMTSSTQAGSTGNSWMVDLSADPKTALFQRLDADKNGYLNQQELQTYKDEIAVNLDRAGSGSGDKQGVDIVTFKTALTNSMLGLGGEGSNESLEGFAHGGLDTSGPADSDAAGMQSDKVMEHVVEEQGGPTMLQSGPNPSSTQPTPEQALTP